ncbi:MAG: DNA/RNA nuclease SfsA, partial [archaeon]
MKYLFKEPLKEGVIKSRPNRFIMLVLIDGKLEKCHCPSTGRIGNIKFED